MIKDIRELCSWLSEVLQQRKKKKALAAFKEKQRKHSAAIIIKIPGQPAQIYETNPHYKKKETQ